MPDAERPEFRHGFVHTRADADPLQAERERQSADACADDQHLHGVDRFSEAGGRECQLGPRRVAQAAVGQRDLALGEDARRAGRATRHRAAGRSRDRVVLGREHAVATDGVEQAAALQQRVHLGRRLHRYSVAPDSRSERAS